jgi:retinoid hydroxylase
MLKTVVPFMISVPFMTQTLPPGDLGFPGIGETIAFFRDRQFALRRHQRHGPVFKTSIFGQKTVFLQGAEGNRFILTNENDYFQVTWPPSVRQLLGPLSLSLQMGPQHASRRKILAQAFQPRALSGYLEAMNEISDRYLDRWVHQGTVTWYPELRDYTLDIACKLLVGLDNGSQTKLGQAYELWGAGLFSIPVNLPWTAFGKALRCRGQLLGEIERLVAARSLQGPGTTLDALDLMLAARDDAGEGLPLAEVKDQVLTLLFAGHETLASSLSSLCLLLAQHPLVLERARAEQMALGPLSFDLLKQMPYLDQILKEVLRVLPPVGGGFRTVLRDCEYGGFTIPQGWQTLYQINATHLDPTIYPDPKQFDPDRFDGDRAEDKQKPFGHVPFGGGLRECIGKEFARLEIKLFAARLLRGYGWELLPDQDLEMVVIPTPKPRDGLKVRFWKL